MDLSELYEYYHKMFVPIYSDYVALTRIKPEQILIEESNILSHLMQSLNPNVSVHESDENLKKAKNHLCRATLDLHKLLFDYLSSELYAYVIKDERKRLCFNASEGEVLETYSSFLQQARDARREEMSNIGLDLQGPVAEWEKTNKLGFELLSKLDELKAAQIRSIVTVVKTKEFLMGVTASVVAASIIAFVSCIFL